MLWCPARDGDIDFNDGDEPENCKCGDCYDGTNDYDVDIWQEPLFFQGCGNGVGLLKHDLIRVNALPFIGIGKSR